MPPRKRRNVPSYDQVRQDVRESRGRGDIGGLVPGDSPSPEVPAIPGNAVTPFRWPQPGSAIHVVLKDHGSTWIIPLPEFTDWVATNAISQQGYLKGGNYKHGIAYYRKRIFPGVVAGFDASTGEEIIDEIEDNPARLRRSVKTDTDSLAGDLWRSP